MPPCCRDRGYKKKKKKKEKTEKKKWFAKNITECVSVRALENSDKPSLLCIQA